MELHAETHDQARLVRIAGEVGATEADELRSWLLEQISPQQPLVVIDCSQLRFIGSSGLAALLAAQQAARAAGGTLRLAAPQPQIRELLRVSRLERILTVHDSVEQALADRGPEPEPR